MPRAVAFLEKIFCLRIQKHGALVKKVQILLVGGAPGDVGHVGCEGLAADIAGDLGEDTVTVVVVLGSLTRPLRSVHLRLSNRLNNDNM